MMGLDVEACPSIGGSAQAPIYTVMRMIRHTFAVFLAHGVSTLKFDQLKCRMRWPTCRTTSRRNSDGLTSNRGLAVLHANGCIEKCMT
jgi:hypothetical protein